MKIGYRRVSGKLPLTVDEVGARGTWLEKRRALIRNLESRGHTFVYLSDPTPNSAAQGYIKTPYDTCDLLMLEFGGNNLMFNKKAWEETFAIIKKHQDKIVFLCDDPDLPFLWNELPDEDWSRWTIAANATQSEQVKAKMKVPAKAQVIDMAFHALLPQLAFTDGQNSTAIYYGRPNGRNKILQPFLSSGALTVAGKQEEWGDVTAITPPEQKNRVEFYRQWRACLAIYDGKHKDTGWRTGRAYHALMAGIPVAAPTGNPALAWTYPADTSSQLGNLLKMPVEARQVLHTEQIKHSFVDIDITFLKLGL
jgi:hypothetical protein